MAATPSKPIANAKLSISSLEGRGAIATLNRWADALQGSVNSVNDAIGGLGRNIQTLQNAVVVPVSDGLIHSTIWEIDPVVVVVKDDLLHLSSAVPTGNFVSDIAWSFTNNGTQAYAIPSFGGMAQGLLQLPANGTPDEGAFLAPGNPGVQNNAAVTNYSWFDSPGWELIWTFSLSRGLGSNNSTQAPAFSMTQVSMYIGLSNFYGVNGFPAAGGQSMRPPFFFGLRYDTDTTAPAISDTQFVFEAVATTLAGSGTGRSNIQGTTIATGITPVEFTEYTLSILCTTAGQAVVTLYGGGASFSSTLTMPKTTYTEFFALANNGQALVSSAHGYQPYAAGTLLTIAGASNEPSLNGTWPLIWCQGQSQQWCSFLSTSNFVQETEITATISGYAAFSPFITFGNDSTAGPTLNAKALNVDLYAFVKNRGVGGGTGTPSTTLARGF
jgi:hypothetical protein